MLSSLRDYKESVTYVLYVVTVPMGCRMRTWYMVLLHANMAHFGIFFIRLNIFRLPIFVLSDWQLYSHRRRDTSTRAQGLEVWTLKYIVRLREIDFFVPKVERSKQTKIKIHRKKTLRFF